MLEHVRECETSIQMLDNIKNDFHRHTILNELRTRRESHAVEMSRNENMVSYTNRAKNLEPVLKSKRVDIDSKKMAMAAINGLPNQYKSLIESLDGRKDEESLLKLELV